MRGAPMCHRQAACVALMRSVPRPVHVRGRPPPRSGTRTGAPSWLAVPPRRDGLLVLQVKTSRWKAPTGAGSPSRHQHVRPKLTLGGLNIVLGELGSSVDDRAHVRVDGLELIFRHEPRLEHAPTHLLDGIVLLA